MKRVSPAKSLHEVEPQSAGGANAEGLVAAAPDKVNASIGRYCWTICALLFFAATINYVDRLRFAPAGVEQVLMVDGGWMGR